MTGRLLHPESFQRPYGERQLNALRDEVAFFASTVVMETPDISVVIQSYADTPAQLHGLFDDLERQNYRGGVQSILVSAGNSKETLDAAVRRGEVMIDNKLRVVRDSLLSVHHTHDFDSIQSIRQLLAWRRMANPRDYDSAEWAWHPHRGF